MINDILHSHIRDLIFGQTLIILAYCGHKLAMITLTEQELCNASTSCQSVLCGVIWHLWFLKEDINSVTHLLSITGRNVESRQHDEMPDVHIHCS